MREDVIYTISSLITINLEQSKENVPGPDIRNTKQKESTCLHVHWIWDTSSHHDITLAVQFFPVYLQQLYECIIDDRVKMVNKNTLSITLCSLALYISWLMMISNWEFQNVPINQWGRVRLKTLYKQGRFTSIFNVHHHHICVFARSTVDCSINSLRPGDAYMRQ